MKNIEVADILREVVSANQLNVSAEQWKAANALLNCRTAALGAHVYSCNACGKEEISYNSCRNRHCPKCQAAATAKWLERRREELLPVPYFHVVFTLPHEFSGTALQNKKLVYGTLFRAVSETITQVGKRRLGGQLGFFSILHTWGQRLEAHPHVHCVIPGVVLCENGSVKTLPKNYLLPQRIISKVFRAIFCKHFRRLYPELEFHGQQLDLNKESSFKRLLNTVFSKDWVVYAKRPFAGPEIVLKYLAQYTHRIAISNRRILSCRNGVTAFRYKNYANGKKKVLQLSNAEFIRRFFLHTLPHQFVRIRYYGFLANGVRTKTLSKLRQHFLLLPPKLDDGRQRCCRYCGAQELIFERELPARILPFPRPKIRHKLPKRKELPLVA